MRVALDRRAAQQPGAPGAALVVADHPVAVERAAETSDITPTISLTPAPPGPPDRYISVGAGRRARCGAIRSGTVPGSTPVRSSGTVSVEQRTARKSGHLLQSARARRAGATSRPTSASSAARATLRAMASSHARPKRSGASVGRPARAPAARSGRPRVQARDVERDGVGREARAARAGARRRAAGGRAGAAGRRWRAGGTAASRACRGRRRPARADSRPGAPPAHPWDRRRARSGRGRGAAGGSRRRRARARARAAGRAAGPRSPPTSAGGRWPRKASVTWSASRPTRAPDGGVGGGGERREGVADRVGEVERDEQAQRAPHASDEQAAQHVHRGRGRAVADVGARAREAGRSARCASAAEDTHRQTVPTGFSGVASARPGDAR